jgi:probable rRNA maturation factor
MFKEHGETSVHFYFKKINFRLGERGRLKRFIDFLIHNEKKKLSSINYVFCNDQALLKINRTYLNHDFYTDIVSFDLSDSPKNILGEIYISIDRVRENAEIFRNSFKDELHRVIFHGVLHLCGYNDKTNRETEIMRKKENLYLNLYKRFT